MTSSASAPAIRLWSQPYRPGRYSTQGGPVELVKRSASITYYTTSAFDLEELASSNRSFDWRIVEEAGRSHGFDLALPLQAGHRWLLLGDQSQLPPYRIDDYAKGIGQHR